MFIKFNERTVSAAEESARVPSKNNRGKSVKRLAVPTVAPYLLLMIARPRPNVVINLWSAMQPTDSKLTVSPGT